MIVELLLQQKRASFHWPFLCFSVTKD
jgi:hypothetical protein